MCIRSGPVAGSQNGDGEEKEAGLDASLVLRGGVGERQDESLQVEAPVHAQNRVHELCPTS